MTCFLRGALMGRPVMRLISRKTASAEESSGRDGGLIWRADPGTAWKTTKLMAPTAAIKEWAMEVQIGSGKRKHRNLKLECRFMLEGLPVGSNWFPHTSGSQ